ncbi:MAG: tRNA (guanosine(37)-N1)-methyltransferase TrmD [Desulfovibrionaceae bacterium]|nr:tRNA (guanosine(37)-N1)-methyltransferase TrmD [Desulfovibrionaceae bacterium]
MLHVHVLTLFPEFFDSPLNCGLMARAKAQGILEFSFHNPREFSTLKHHHLDDSPYGGGPGMVMQAKPLIDCLAALKTKGRVVLLTPRGRPFTQKVAQELAKEDHLTLICGRYEGIDDRLSDLIELDPICVTDAVLNSGDSAALCLIEACARLQPGFMGKLTSSYEESFSDNILEYPQYTRPETLCGLKVPEVLLSGHHQNIATFRRNKALEATFKYRPDLLEKASLSEMDAAYLRSMPKVRPSRNLSLVLVHHPVRIEGKANGTSSLTNLDIHDIARISVSYGLGPFYVVTPLADQLQILKHILEHWLSGKAAEAHPDRAKALSMVRPLTSLEEVFSESEAYFGLKPYCVVSSAHWPKKKDPPLTVPFKLRKLLARQPVLLLLGTAQGLATEARLKCDAMLRPLRFLGYNHLSVRSAAAILVDRILGDFT